MTTLRSRQPENEGWNPGALTGCGTPATYPTDTSSSLAGVKATVTRRYSASNWGQSYEWLELRLGKAKAYRRPRYWPQTWTNQPCLYSAPPTTQFLFTFTSLKTIRIIQIIKLHEACNSREFRNSTISPQLCFKEFIKIVPPQLECTEKFLAGLSFAVQMHGRISNNSLPRSPTSWKNFSAPTPYHKLESHRRTISWHVTKPLS